MRDARRAKCTYTCDYKAPKRLVWGAWVVHHTPLGAKLHEPGSNSVVRCSVLDESSQTPLLASPCATAGGGRPPLES